MIEIIPAIDLIDGKCVRLVQGDFSRVKEYSSDPLRVAREFADAGIRRLHLVDLDGARAGSTRNLAVLESIARNTELVIDFSGGLRSAADLRQIFEAGADIACVGSLAATAPDVFFELLDAFGAEKILLAADSLNDRVAIEGWTFTTDQDLLSLLREYVDRGGRQALVTDISRDGLLGGPSVNLYSRIRAAVPELNLIASGGVSSMRDVDDLERIGCQGVIVGKAIYEGRIKLADLAVRI